MSSINLSREVFQRLQQDFLDNVDLKTLIPLLNQKKLLTDADEQELTNELHIPRDRIRKLTQILRQKGPQCPSKVLECLRQDKSHCGHAHLARLLHDFLQTGNENTHLDSHDENSSDMASGRGVENQSHMALGDGDGMNQQPFQAAISPSQGRHNPPPFQERSHGRHDPPTVPPFQERLHGRHDSSSTPPFQDRSHGRRDPPNILPFQDRSHGHYDPSTVPPVQETSYGHHNPPSYNGIPGFNQQYTQLISNLDFELTQKSIPFQTVVDNLQSLFENDGIPIDMPPEVTDFTSLCSYLYRRKLCHELDVDLLSKLFHCFRLDDLRQMVLDYARSIEMADVLQYQNAHIRPSDSHFLMFTHHNCPHLTLGKVFEIKDYLSRLLQVPRHTFTLTTSQTGSIVLVWQFPLQCSKLCQSSFEEESVQSKLVSDAYLYGITTVKLQYPNSTEQQVIFRQSHDSSSDTTVRTAPTDDVVSSTTEDSIPLHQRGTKRDRSPTIEMTAPPPKSRHTEVDPDTSVKPESTPTRSKRSVDIVENESEMYPSPAKKRTLPSKHPSLQEGNGQRELFSETTPSDFAGQYVPEATFQVQECNYYGPDHEMQLAGASDRDTRTCMDSSQTIQPQGFQSLLKTHQPLLVDRLDLMTLLPHLNRHHLLTPDENEIMMNRLLTQRDRIQNLLSFMERKGPEGCQKFFRAIEEETTHLGHKEVIETIKPSSEYRESVDTPCETLAKNLKAYYTGSNYYQMTAGPKIGRVEFIRLALIKNQGVSEDEKERDRFLKSTLHGLVDDITKKKKSIDMYKVFEYGSGQGRKLVLVEGAPGVGKTMLAMKLCEDWACGKILQEYDLVILVPLRSFQGETKIGMDDIISLYLEGALATRVSQDLQIGCGERVMLFLEGWDELPPKLRQEFTFFFDIVMGRKLPKASVMVTSRPTVTAPLYDYMDERRIEVLGFSPKQVEEFVLCHAGDNAEEVLVHLKKFPNLRAMAHIPLTLVIICHVANQENTIPPTLTELYNKYICSTLFQNLKKQSEEEFKSLLGLSSLSDLPGNAPAIVEALCKLALRGFEEKSFVYESKDLVEAGLRPTGSFDGYGLLSTTRMKAAAAGHKLFYQFRHLSIQEFLAALQIMKLDVDARIALLREYRSDQQFQNVWKFLSGISGLQDEDLQRIIISDTKPANRDQLFLLHCLYEAHDPEICQVAAAKLNHTLNLNNMTLNTTDCLCAVYTISSAGGDWNVDLRGCNIGADGLEVFKWRLSEQAATSNLKIASLNLMHNRLDSEAIEHLAEIITGTVHLVDINLGSNKFEDDGVKLLAGALTGNETVRRIHFTHCELTAVATEALAGMLRQNNALKTLYIGFEPLIGDTGVIHLASALVDNNSLNDLSLSDTTMGYLGLCQLATLLKVNKTLEVLRIDRNNLGVRECEVIAEIIKTHNSLRLIDLSKNPIGDEGFSIVIDALIARPGGTLKKMGVFGCGISGKALVKLVDFFAVTEIFEGIQLGCNPLGDEGAEHLANAISQNVSKSVKQILLESTGISEKGRELLASKSREGLDISYEHHGLIVKKSMQKTDTRF